MKKGYLKKEDLKVIIRENTWLSRTIGLHKLDFGWGNGYVILPKTHPLHGVDYDEINTFVDVHRGLTYGSIITVQTIINFNLDPEDLGKYMVGFDTSHYGDNLLKWSEQDVLKETENLKEQLYDYYEKMDIYHKWVLTPYSIHIRNISKVHSSMLFEAKDFFIEE